VHEDDDKSASNHAADIVPRGKLTRAEVARRLGVSVTTLRRMEGTKLHPTRRADGVHVFDETEVESVLVTYRQVRSRTTRVTVEDGAIAARAFECFDQRVSVSEVVKRLEIAPERAAALQLAWSRLNRIDLNSGIAHEVTPEGELAARAFEMFAMGSSPRSVVMELRQPPDVIRKLFDDFLAFSAAEGAITFPWHMVREILDLAGLPTDRASDAQTIIHVIRTMRERIRELIRTRNEATEELARLRSAPPIRAPEQR
jgi:hypothetical protein